MRTSSDGSTQRCAPNGFSGVHVALSSDLSVSGSSRDVGEADGVVTGELLAVERGALEQVRELLAKARVVERELLGPRPSLDLGVEDHSYGTASSAARAMSKPSGCSRSSTRCASRLAVRARIGTAFTAADG